jgi:hypothetical protein
MAGLAPVRDSPERKSADNLPFGYAQDKKVIPAKAKPPRGGRVYSLMRQVESDESPATSVVCYQY